MTMHYLLLGLLLPLSVLHASGAGKGQPLHGPSATPAQEPINQPLSMLALKGSPKEIFRRVVQARLYHLGSWALPDPVQTPVTAARTIASLRPSFVTGLLRLPDRGIPRNAEIEAFNTVRNAMISNDNKECRFDIVINIAAERDGEPLIRRMKEISTLLHHDAWTFYVAPDENSVNPSVFEDGIAYAHSQGQMVGYDGPLFLVPDGVDYIVVRAWDLKVNRSQIEHLRTKQRVPLIVELPSTFGSKPNPDCNTYVRGMTSAERGKFLTAIAENQTSWGYHFAYPVFYPVEPNMRDFDATKDSILMVMLRSLMARFN